MTSERAAPERREIGVLIVDLANFTQFVETTEPERTFATLGEYHDAFTPIVERHQGIVMDLVGDAVCLMFRATPAAPDPELRTVRAALDVQGSLAALVQGWKRRGDSIDFGIGVSFGYATLGHVSVAERSEYHVVGATVIVAARLASLARGGRVFATERLANDASSVASGTLVAGVEVGGLRQPPRVFELARRDATPASDPASRR